MRAYVARLRGLLVGCGASVATASNQFLRFLREAAEGMDLAFTGTPADSDQLPEQEVELRPSGPTEIAYLQYTVGSTSFPRGVVITQRGVLSNLAGGGRSWSRHQARRRWCRGCRSTTTWASSAACSRRWPHSARSTISHARFRDAAAPLARVDDRHEGDDLVQPAVRLRLCARRIRPEDVAGYDSRRGASPASAPSPFAPSCRTASPRCSDRPDSIRAPFVPCYGMAESWLAISRAARERCGRRLDRCRSLRGAVARDSSRPHDTGRVNGFVRCGGPLPGHEVAVRDHQGRPLPDLHVGRITVRGPSVMSGYFAQPEQTRQSLSHDGWLDTGDIGYLVEGSIVVTGRHKDMIIINGRNIWPQDIEHIAERQPELRPMDASAFFVLGSEDEEVAVVVVQSNINDPPEGGKLTQRLHREIHEELGISCVIELVPRHTLPRTSSGKLSQGRRARGLPRAARAGAQGRAGAAGSRRPMPRRLRDRRPTMAVFHGRPSLWMREPRAAPASTPEHRPWLDDDWSRASDPASSNAGGQSQRRTPPLRKVWLEIPEPRRHNQRFESTMAYARSVSR